MNFEDCFFKQFFAAWVLVVSVSLVGCTDGSQLKSLVRDPAAIEVLAAALDDQDPCVRRASARALGRMNNPKALDALRNSLEHRDACIRHEAAWALWERTDDSKLLVSLRGYLQNP